MVRRYGPDIRQEKSLHADIVLIESALRHWRINNFTISSRTGKDLVPCLSFFSHHLIVSLSDTAFGPSVCLRRPGVTSQVSYPLLHWSTTTGVRPTLRSARAALRPVYTTLQPFLISFPPCTEEGAGRRLKYHICMLSMSVCSCHALATGNGKLLLLPVCLPASFTGLGIWKYVGRYHSKRASYHFAYGRMAILEPAHST